MYYARVSQIEAFRRTRDYRSRDGSESPFDDAALKKYLTGEFAGNEKTAIGTSFHAIVEKGLVSIETELLDDGSTLYKYPETDVVFNDAQFSAALAYREELQGMISEVSSGKVYKTRLGDVMINGTLDVLHGVEIRDIKCRFSSLDPSDYVESSQWKFYLDIFDCDTFKYDVFEYKNYKSGLNVSRCGLVRHEPIPCIRYAALEHDCTLLVSDFLDYIESRGLLEYFIKPDKKYKQ